MNHEPEQTGGAAGGTCGKGRPGFSLVEILIVVVILGILATIVIPKFSNATTLAAENTMKETLRTTRTQIQVYRFQHNETMPGQTGNGYDGALFAQQMTLPTDLSGNVGAPNDPAFPFGPYLRQMPPNPLNNRATVLVVNGVGALPNPDGAFGWIYQGDRNTFVADQPGTDAAGVAYVNY